jgi:excisionase family DNA binding protein
MADQLLLSIVDTARVLGVGRSTVYLLISRGELPVVHVGRRALIHVDAVHAYVAGLGTSSEAE